MTVPARLFKSEMPGSLPAALVRRRIAGAVHMEAERSRTGLRVRAVSCQAATGPQGWIMAGPSGERHGASIRDPSSGDRPDLG